MVPFSVGWAFPHQLMQSRHPPHTPPRQSVTHRLTWSRQSRLVSLFIAVLDCFTLTDIVFFHVELTQWRENNSVRHMDTHTQACTWLHTHIHTCNQICTSYRKEIKRNEEEQRESHTLRNNPWMRHWPAKLPREREEISQTYWAAYKDVQRASGVKLSWMSPVLGWVFWWCSSISAPVRKPSPIATSNLSKDSLVH